MKIIFTEDRVSFLFEAGIELTEPEALVPG